MKLTKEQVQKCKQYFDKNAGSKMLAAQGHISTLMDMAFTIFGNTNYSIIQDNLKQLF